MSKQDFQVFNVIRKRGSPNDANVEIPIPGNIIKFTAYRQEYMYAPEPYNALVPCLDYRNHFLYEIVDDPMFSEYHFPSFLCTCGSYAAIIGQDAYITDTSPQGLVWACYCHNGLVDPLTEELYGYHADGSIG